MKSLYSTLVVSHMNYGILAWGNCNTTLIDRIFKIQKRAVRVINQAGFYSHTNPLFFKNKILKIADIHLFQLGIFMFQLSKDELPGIFACMFQRNNLIHTYPTRQKDSYHLPRTRTLFAQRSIAFEGPRFWNDLPHEVVQSTSLNIFKRKLKTMLLNSYLLSA